MWLFSLCETGRIKDSGGEGKGVSGEVNGGVNGEANEDVNKEINKNVNRNACKYKPSVKLIG